MEDPWDAYRAELALRDLALATRTRYGQVVNAFRGWLGDREPATPRAREYLAHLRDKGYLPASVLLHYHALQGFFEFLGQPLKLKLRKPKRLPPYYDSGDIERLIAQAERGLPRQSPSVRQRNVALILLMAYGGLRRGEVLGLGVRDLDFNQHLIRVIGKGSKERVIPMSERLLLPLRTLCLGRPAGAPLFEGLTAKTVHRAVVKLSRAAGLEGFHPHCLRHAFATRLVERGANLRAVQELLGHEDLSTTAVYIGVAAQHLREAICLLDEPPGATAQT